MGVPVVGRASGGRTRTRSRGVGVGSTGAEDVEWIFVPAGRSPSEVDSLVVIGRRGRDVLRDGEAEVLREETDEGAFPRARWSLEQEEARGWKVAGISGSGGGDGGGPALREGGGGGGGGG